MAKKLPAMMFYVGDWLKDPAVARCSPATRGIWLDALCAMHEDGRSGVLVGTVTELSRVCRCSPDEMQIAIDELKRTGAADVSLDCPGTFRLDNRRMMRDAEEREKERKKKAGQRSASPKKKRPEAAGKEVSPQVSRTCPPDVPFEYEIENENEVEVQIEFPSALNTPEFRSKFDRWRVVRRNKHHDTLDAIQASEVLLKLSRWGLDGAMESLENAITGGWKNVRPPEPKEKTDARHLTATLTNAERREQANADAFEQVKRQHAVGD